ncbi:hypothetical protein ACC792_37805, partial [Rhizobium ruizarguesonis]
TSAAPSLHRPNPSRTDRRLCRSRRTLRRQGYYTVKAQTLTDLLRSGKPIQGRPVMLTLDDAYLDFLTDAFPILAENDFSA